MRLIGELNDSKLASQFSAYLLTLGITTQVEEEGELWEIWVKEEDHLGESVKALEEFRWDPNNDRYQGSLEKANQIAIEEQKRKQLYQKNVVKMSGRRSSRRAPLTLLLIVISAIVALATNFGNASKSESVVYRALSFTSIEPPAATELIDKYQGDYDNINVRTASLKRGEVWRLVTPIFIHFSTMHIVFNMIWLFQFGNMIENRYGTFWLALLVLAAAAVPNLVQSIVPAQFGGSSPGFDGGYLLSGLGGMSGVVYGLFGFIWVKSMYDPGSGFRLPQSTVIILIAWLFICFFFIGNIANWAHAIGLLVGMVAGYLPTMIGGSSAART